MKEMELTELKLALHQLDILRQQYDVQTKPLIKIRTDFIQEVEEWFELYFINEDSKLSDEIKKKYYDEYSDVEIENNKVKFTIGEWDYESVFIQYFKCEVPVDEILDVVNNKKSLWDYKPNTEVEYI